MQRGAKSNAIRRSEDEGRLLFSRQKKNALASGTVTGSGSQTRGSPQQKQTNKPRGGGATKSPPQLYLDAVANLNLPARERGKGRLCNVSAKSQRQTHLHLLGLPVAFEFFRVASPSASRSPLNAPHSLCHLSIKAMCKRAL